MVLQAENGKRNHKPKECFAMKISISENSVALGRAAAADIAARLNASIAEKGSARLVLSTGASQFDMFSALVELPIDWSKVEMFHLDEYIGIPDTHIASFRKYLKERFLARVPNLTQVHLVNVEGDIETAIADISAKLLEKPVDVGVIGIGENGHIAFNDPPADFATTDPFIIVTLDDACKKQQVREGWFPDLDSVPKQAVSMSVFHILQSKAIISVVPHAVKAQAVKNTLTLPVSPSIPAAMLKMHPDWTLYLDENSAAELDRDQFARFLI
jgi:glucosamine-6-phosphate deaminase